MLPLLVTTTSITSLALRPLRPAAADTRSRTLFQRSRRALALAASRGAVAVLSPMRRRLAPGDAAGNARKAVDAVPTLIAWQQETPATHLAPSC